ncbi:MAG: MFS transporter, partial [Solirubrobacteraceae bacterium]
PEGDGGMSVAVRDRIFLITVAFISILGLQGPLLEVGVPLWVSQHTAAPRWTVAVVLVVNTLGCVLFQVPVARRAEGAGGARRACRRGGLFVAVACGLFALGGSPGAEGAVVLVVAGGVAHVAGELEIAAGSWSLSFGLSPDASQAQYQGLFVAGLSAADTAGPILMAAVVGAGSLGLGALGIAMLAAGSACGLMSTRPSVRDRFARALDRAGADD